MRIAFTNFVRAQAFSLLELLIVLALIATMAGAAVVALQGRDDPHALRASAEDLASAIRFAVAEAERTGAKHRVRFVELGRGFRVERYQEHQASGWTQARGAAGIVRNLPEGVWLQQEVAAAEGQPPSTGQVVERMFEFGGRGSFSGQVALVNEAGEAMAVRVAPLSRQVTVLELDWSNENKAVSRPSVHPG